MAIVPPDSANGTASTWHLGRLDPEADGGDAFAEGLAADMADRWRRGERPLVEEYLQRYPFLVSQLEALLVLVYEEICQRRELGEQAATQEVARRFPEWAQPIQVLVECQRLLEAERETLRFPSVGEKLGDFQLVAELGRGGRGRVFLATQPLLADRPVVLKLAPCDGAEHLALARLQHTHIMPLYGVHDFPAHKLRALCMPYLGGTTLERLLENLAAIPPVRRTGQHLLEAVERAQAGNPLAVPAGGPAWRFLARASYAQAVCWIGACLADALQYAAERGLVHLDVKPANVLLAADGQPLLLDFHLARPPIIAGAPGPESLGGTLPYMAPEQRAAMEAVPGEKKVAVAVDWRADIYSLGCLLFEALGGMTPSGAGTGTPMPGRHALPVSVGLADILTKCLAPDPADRYPDAAALAADLRRHLADLPLRGVANRSVGERWAKWRRRRPYALTVAGWLLATVACGGLVCTHVIRQAKQIQAACAEGCEHLHEHRYAQAVSALKSGLALAEEVPFAKNLFPDLRIHLRSAERGQAATELHGLAERLRPHGAAPSLTPSQARAFAETCRRFWDDRALIAHRLGDPLLPELEQQIQTDLLDLAIIGNDLRVRLVGREGADAAHREALDVLAEAEHLFGPNAVIAYERWLHERSLGLPGPDTQDSTPQPQTAWEHFALGRMLYRAGDLERAAAELERSLDAQPDALWTHFYLGSCAYDQARFDDAVKAFTVCVALAPDRGWCFYNRGLAETARQHADRALADYDQALRLDPGLVAASLNRGMLHYRAGRYRDALADLQRALEGGWDPAVVSYDLALVHCALGDDSAAKAWLDRALRHDPHHASALSLRERLRQAECYPNEADAAH